MYLGRIVVEIGATEEIFARNRNIHYARVLAGQQYLHQALSPNRCM